MDLEGTYFTSGGVDICPPLAFAACGIAGREGWDRLVDRFVMSVVEQMLILSSHLRLVCPNDCSLNWASSHATSNVVAVSSSSRLLSRLWTARFIHSALLLVLTVGFKAQDCQWAASMEIGLMIESSHCGSEGICNILVLKYIPTF